MTRFLCLTFCGCLLISVGASLAYNNPIISFCFSHEYPSDCHFQNLMASKFEFGQTGQNTLNVAERNESFLQLKCGASYPIRWLSLQPLGSVSHVPQNGNETMESMYFKYTNQIYVELKTFKFSQIFRCLSYSNASLFSELFLNIWNSKDNQPALSFNYDNINSFIVEDFTEYLRNGNKRFIIPCIAKQFGPNLSVKLVKYRQSFSKHGISVPTQSCAECICKATSHCAEGQFPCTSPNVCGTLPSLIWKRNGVDATEIEFQNLSDCSNMTGHEVAPLVRRYGARVARGSDWKWGNEEGYPRGDGRVVSVDEDGWVTVQWPAGKKSDYRMGAESKYDLRPLDCSTNRDDIQCNSNSTCATDKLLTHFWFLYNGGRETDCDGDGVVTCYDYALASPSSSTQCAVPVTSHMDKLRACLINKGDNFTVEAIRHEDYDPRIGIRTERETDGDSRYECAKGIAGNRYYNPLNRKKQMYATLSLRRKNEGKIVIQCKAMPPYLRILVGKCNSILDCDLKFNSVLPRVIINEREVAGREDIDFHMLKKTNEVVPKFENGFIICSRTFQFNSGFIYVDDYLFTALDNQLCSASFNK